MDSIVITIICIAVGITLFLIGVWIMRWMLHLDDIRASLKRSNENEEEMIKQLERIKNLLAKNEGNAS